MYRNLFLVSRWGFMVTQFL